ILVAGACRQVDALAGVGRPAQTHMPGLGTLLVKCGQSRHSGILQRIAIPVFTPDVDPQFAWHQWTTEVKAALVLVAIQTMIGDQGMAADRALPAVGRRTRNDVDDPAQR